MSGTKSSETLASVMLLAKTIGVTDENILSQLSSFFLSESKKGVAEVILNRPMQVTVKKVAGGFSKRPMIGDEPMQVVGAYLGKRDGVIVQARVSDEKTTDIIEIPAHIAEDALDGYKTLVSDFVNSYGMTSDIEEANAAREEATRIEQEARDADLRKIRLADERFGSW